MIRFDNLPPEVMQAMCTPMHQVLAPSPIPGHPGYNTGALYLGSLSAVQDKDLLRQHHITHLVQVLDVPWLPLSEKDGFNCYRIDILDQSTADLRPHLEAVCAHIDRTLRSGRSVLVHCQQGVSRSPAVVIAYLIRNHGMSLDNAHTLVKRKRACIKPNSGFIKALQEWEAAGRRPPAVRRFTS
ncbi:protein-tyrosine phosphatase-like protein [Crassisporium funariophilum]|nr:protein-tyrosine phosphatase-like protein [Crassisporium funariophilum]